MPLLQRRHERSSAYNLEEEEDLTHYGQSLGDMERFDDIQLSEEEMEEGVCMGGGKGSVTCMIIALAFAEDIGKTHFGGFLKKKTKQLHAGEESESPKTRKQVLEEIVVKSKAMKVSTVCSAHPQQTFLRVLLTCTSLG